MRHSHVYVKYEISPRGIIKVYILLPIEAAHVSWTNWPDWYSDKRERESHEQTQSMRQILTFIKLTHRAMIVS